MRLRRLLAVLAALALILGAALLCFRLFPRRTPRGQAPLEELVSLQPLRAAFNAGKDRYRVLALFSPTCGVCTEGATSLGTLLHQVGRDRNVEPLIVWLPVIATDLGPPTSDKLALFDNPTARQFWDPDHIVSREILAFARKHLDRLSAADQQRALSARVAWDIVAVYPPGATWDAELPWPTSWGRPVVRALESVRQQLLGPGDTR